MADKNQELEALDDDLKQCTYQPKLVYFKKLPKTFPILSGKLSWTSFTPYYKNSLVYKEPANYIKGGLQKTIPPFISFNKNKTVND